MKRMLLVVLALFALMTYAISLRAEEAKDGGKAEAKPGAKKEEAKKEEAKPAAEGEAKYSLSLEPSLRWIEVSGDEGRFREHWWMTDDWAGGGEFSFTRQLTKDVKLDLEGRGIWDDEDFKLGINIEKKDVGYIRADFTQYRKFFDDSGGQYQRFLQPWVRHQDPDRDLALRIGDINVEMGLRAPNLPQVTLGYEHQYKDGRKSMVEWGTVQQLALPGPAQPNANVSKKIFPAYKDIDETVDIIKANVEHDLGNVHLENDFRWEHYSNKTYRLDDAMRTYTAAGALVTAGLPISNLPKDVTVTELLHDDLFSNTFTVDSHLNEKLYVSGGYLFTTLQGGAMTRVFTDPYIAGTDKRWQTHGISLSQDSHVINGSFMAGPFANLTGYAGVQGEFTDTEGRGRADLFEFANPTERGIFDTRNDKGAVEEHAGVRFTGIPFTVLYFEGRWGQQDIDLREYELEQTAPATPWENAFERLTDTQVNRQSYTVGASTSPIKKVTLTGRYRHTVRDNDYNHKIDIYQDPPVSNAGRYSAFITGQQFYTDEVMAKVAWRPLPKVNLSFMYQFMDMRYDTSHQGLTTTTINFPAGSLHAADYNSNTWSGSATYTPMARLYLTGTLSYQDTTTEAFDHGARSIVPYRGNVFSVLGRIGYILDPKSDLTLDYIVSTSNNFQNNGYSPVTRPGFVNNDFGLPLGLDYQQHGLTVGYKRKLSDNLAVGLNYGFFLYDEGSNHHVDDYTAHMVSGNLSLRF